MRKEDIKNIMVVYSDNDFITSWDWIGKVVLMTINSDTNICGGKVLEDSNDIENFIISLLPSAIEFLQYRQDKYEEFDFIQFSRYENVNKEDVIELVNHFDNVRFKYNFDKKNDDDFLYGGSETLIIDIENNKSYIK